MARGATERVRSSDIPPSRYVLVRRQSTPVRVSIPEPLHSIGVLLDCERCGACCFSESPRHARVTGDDYERLGDDAERLVTFLGNQAFMRLEDFGAESPIGRCAALVLDPASGRYLCSVYERRPAVCRELERGSPACAGERETKDGRPRRALARLVLLTSRRLTPPA
jgi:Fe-S-cluster containining protein